MDPESALSKLTAIFDKSTSQIILEWFQNYWYLLVIAVCFISLLIAMFKVQTKKQKREPLTSLAIQSGKMALLWQRANDEKKQLERDAEQLEISFHEMVDREHKQKPIDYVVAVARMSNFFPTVSQNELLRSLQVSNSEEYAVRQFLLRGFPMKQLLNKKEAKIIADAATSI
jgi:hypothetical protein